MTTTPPIEGFRGAFGFLSNFTLASVELDGVAYPSVENAYQAAKTLDPLLRLKFQGGSPAEAKARGRRVRLREGWDEIKFGVMLGLLRQKFDPARHPVLAKSLLATGDAELVEENYWGDRLWGRCNGVGDNRLGKLLMDVRAELVRAARSKAASNATTEEP